MYNCTIQKFKVAETREEAELLSRELSKVCFMMRCERSGNQSSDPCRRKRERTFYYK